MHAKIVEIVAKELNVAANTLTPATKLRDLSTDELDLNNVFMAFEDHFEFEWTTDDAEAIVTLQDIESYLQRNGKI
ncbi:MAG TPA: phosphopantetheine-binding protein [Kofleriaceae bacterium]|jgi:acyl carrier protein|nr:phosphopantetheine-binding protein [Kofleriaceae bacterium]